MNWPTAAVTIVAIIAITLMVAAYAGRNKPRS